MKRVFKNDAWESVSMQGNVVLCGFYHRYWNPDRTRNAAFDMFSALILDVKEKKEQAIDMFFNQLDGEICDDISICVVSSHSASEHNESCVSLLARKLAAHGRIDKNRCITTSVLC